MHEEKIEYKGYTATISYRRFSPDGTPDCKHHLKVEKDGKVYRDVHGFTNNGAKTEFRRWVDKKTNKQ